VTPAGGMKGVNKKWRKPLLWYYLIENILCAISLKGTGRCVWIGIVTICHKETQALSLPGARRPSVLQFLAFEGVSTQKLDILRIINAVHHLIEMVLCCLGRIWMG
jgi:hypothetical protein